MGRNRRNNRHHNSGNYGGGQYFGQSWSDEQSNHVDQNQGFTSPTRQFYLLDEHLGSEDRTTEFKKGPGFIKNGFRESVAKYICGFLNSRENGKLLIGVEDSGRVTGYDLTHNQEDNLRRELDEAAKDIEPCLFTDGYSIRFVPVCSEDQQRLGNVKVIEIYVQGASAAVDKLYCNKQGAFMRRDGGIQELRAKEIQEWTRRRYEGELEKQRKNQENLEQEVRRLKGETSNTRQLEQKLQQKNDELQRRDAENERIRYDLERQTSRLNQMAESHRNLEDQIRQRREDNGAQISGEQIMEQLNKIQETVQKQQTTSKDKKKSKVCTIS